MLNPRKAGCFLAAFLIASVPMALAQGTYTQIDPPASVTTRCLGVDSVGDVVGWYINGNFKGFLLSGGSYTTIAYNVSNTSLSGINDSGQIVGGSVYGGFVYDVQTQVFTKVAFPGTHEPTNPTSINNAGTIAGYYLYHGSQFGFELIGATYTKIQVLGITTTSVNGVSGQGALVGTGVSKRTGSNVNFLYSQGKYRQLQIPNAPGAAVLGISPMGNALVGAYGPSTGVVAGFVYQNNTLQTLQFPGSNNTVASGINDAGEVVGWFYDSSNVQHGFTWTPPGDPVKK